MSNQKPDNCKWCEQGWIPCEEHGHSPCDGYVNGHYKKIMFEQDEDIPNGAWGTNIYNKITQILSNLYSQAYTDGAVVRKPRNDEILTAHKEIINLIESVLPEEKPTNPSKSNKAFLANRGYNQAISDIKSKLIDGGESNE